MIEKEESNLNNKTGLMINVIVLICMVCGGYVTGASIKTVATDNKDDIKIIKGNYVNKYEFKEEIEKLEKNLREKLDADKELLTVKLNNIIYNQENRR